MASEEVQAWFDRAQGDLTAAEYLLEGDFFEESAFYSQQAAEKAINAVYLQKFGEVSKSHELVGIGRKAGLEKELLAGCEELTGFYITSRYPGLEDEIGFEDAEVAIKTARKVLEWSKTRLT